MNTRQTYKWWEDSDNKVYEIDCDYQEGIKRIMYKDGIYAYIRWFHHSCDVVFFKDGKAYEDHKCEKELD